VTLPTIGVVRVHDDTRRLRRLLRPVAQLDRGTGQSRMAPRAKILFATVSRHGSRWYVSLNVQAPDLHANRRHLPRPAGDDGFVGLDRGLIAFAVAATADGAEVGRFRAPMEDRAVANPITNRRLTRSIGDAAWAEFARQLTYKAAWFRTELVVCDRWFASTKICSVCGNVARQMGLAERTFAVRLRLGHRPRPQRRRQPRSLGRTLPCPSPGPPSRRPGHQRPWRGRRWPSPWR
jgi:transposase